jgi:hypothetical protein
MTTLEERKAEFSAQVALIENPEVRRLARLRGMDKLVEEFGNESEKFGVQFGLYPIWASLDGELQA